MHSKIISSIRTLLYCKPLCIVLLCTVLNLPYLIDLKDINSNRNNNNYNYNKIKYNYNNNSIFIKIIVVIIIILKTIKILLFTTTFIFFT